MPLDDRMKQENQKAVAESIFAGASTSPAGVADNSGSHPDWGFANGLFEDSNLEVPQQVSPAASGCLDLSAFASVPTQQGRAGIREDLVQQAAQSLVRDQNDAVLAITGKMTPDEIGVTLATARQWRRSDPDWQDSFRSAPETGFKFIDHTTGAPKNKVKTVKSNKAEALAREVVAMMQENKLDPADAPKVVRTIIKQRGLTMSERQLVRFATMIANSL